METLLNAYDASEFCSPGRSMPADVFEQFRLLIRSQTGISLRQGKEVMLASRLVRRLRHHSLRTFADYFHLLQGSNDGGKEMREFINCVTTNKTAFFRESHHFDFLADTVVAEALSRASHGAERTMRVWSAAASTGEEPYSIAMTLQRSTPPGSKLVVEASDIDTAVLDTARAGTYPESAIDDLDPTFSRTHFLKGTAQMSGMVRVRPELRDLVRFQRINLMDANWPIDPGLDAIFFRNALIYFDQETQSRFLRKMLRLLRPEGYLFLGHSENVPWLHDAVKPLSRTVYRKLPASKADAA